MVRQGISHSEMARELNRTKRSIESKLSRLQLTRLQIPQSPFPVLGEDEDVLHSEGDAVIIPDLEAPFHHAAFVNRVLDLAYSWGIKTLHLAGDMMHYDSLSKWGSKWTSSEENTMNELQEFLMSIDDEEVRARGFEVLEKMENPDGTVNYQNEVNAARKTFQAIDGFENILCALGNHDDRFIRALDKTVGAEELLHQMGVDKDNRWKISKYYYTKLKTSKGIFRISHQRGAGANAAQDLVSQFHTHVLCAHSHRWSMSKDKSGTLWAILMGHCVDERRLAYVMTRDARRDSHALGAVIIRDGVPYMLHEDSAWDLLKRM